jgi:hypothetical protein
LYDKIPFASTKPAFTALIVGDDGRIWAREFTFGSEASRWLIFDASGRHLGMIEIPVSSDVMDAGRDWVLTRAVDSLGVHTVNLSALTAK